MKSFIIAIVAVICLGSCSKQETRYMCNGTINGNVQLWSPSDDPITKKELNAAIKAKEAIGFTNIKCQPK